MRTRTDTELASLIFNCNPRLSDVEFAIPDKSILVNLVVSGLQR